MLHGKIDLNLFLVLRTVFEEGSITAAANKLYLTQPAVSHALARLREKFDDPLFVRHGRKMQPTELCIKIMPRVIQAIAALETTLQGQVDFDIKQHDREINLGFRDILEALFFSELMSKIQSQAPGIRLRSQQVSLLAIEDKLAKGGLDIVIDVLFPVGGQIKNRALCSDKFVLVCRKNHPIATDTCLERYLSCKHVIASLKDSDVNSVDIALTQHQQMRDVALRCENYFAATRVVSKSDLIITMPRAYALLVAEQLALTILDVPFEVAPIPVHMYWHEKVDDDPVNQWMRTLLNEVAKEVLPDIYCDSQ